MMRTDGLDTNDSLMTDSDLHLTSELATANLELEREHSSRVIPSLPSKRTRRIPSFQAYVKSLPLEEQARIRQAERTYLDGRKDRVRHEETIFAEQMIGCSDQPEHGGRK